MPSKPSLHSEGTTHRCLLSLLDSVQRFVGVNDLKAVGIIASTSVLCLTIRVPGTYIM